MELEKRLATKESDFIKKQRERIDSRIDLIVKAADRYQDRTERLLKEQQKNITQSMALSGCSWARISSSVTTTWSI